MPAMNEIVEVFFYPIGSRLNPAVLQPGTYHRGSANIVPSSSNLVNRLWVKGGNATSLPYTQTFTVTADPFELNYPPRAPVTIEVDGLPASIGIQHIHEPGTFDFLLNAAEKLIIPDQITSGTAVITYRYRYPIKILLEEPTSQQQYGIFEDIITVDTEEKDLALELGFRHLFKYSQPVISGNLEPFRGTYRPGEYIHVRIPHMGIEEYLEITEVMYESVPGAKRTNVKLGLESPERDVGNVLKDLRDRLFKLERQVYADDEGPIEKYIARGETWRWLEQFALTPPISVTQTSSWAENFNRIRFVCPLPGDEQYPSEDLIPC